ncbi:MAG: hypothetical protein V2J07_08760 [Anaerolineae bacterium]|jgi:hypothetical protein|nr:hypothetical protein [Anaerolineae bacterium]
MTANKIEIGAYRPIYLWGGPGTIRMNRVKFMDQKVNEFAHHEVHTIEGANKVVGAIYSNWIHLMYDWGFPPEIEWEDWEDFKKACAIYHELGVKVFAYIQTSNCVFQGSFQSKDWYALDANGRKVYYYTQRYMANLLHPEWQAHIRELITRAIDDGADGIFFDNLWDGAMPISLMGTWLGNAGSYDPISKRKYFDETGTTVPLDVAEDTGEVREYLNWRIRKVTSVVAEFAAHARRLKPDVMIGANDFDMVMRNSPVIYGLSLEQQAQIQDITMIENFSIPKWNSHKDVLVNNAQTIRVARELVGDAAHLSVLSYDDGIGFDGMYHPLRFRQTIAEAAACGATNTIKGTEYFHDGQHTMLTANGFEVQCGAIGDYQRWLEAHAEFFKGKRKNLADVVLFYPEEDMVFHWHLTAPIFFATGQVLLKAGIPWRVARKSSDIANAKTVFVFSKNHHQRIHNSILVAELDGWGKLSSPKPLSKHKTLRKLLYSIVEPLWRSYFASKGMRRLIDHLRLFKLFTGTALFDLPPASLQTILLSTVISDLPRVSSSQPVLMEVWQKENVTQVHLVNYAENPQQVSVEFAEPVEVEVFSPDIDRVETMRRKKITIQLNVYSILVMKEA